MTNKRAAPLLSSQRSSAVSISVPTQSSYVPARFLLPVGDLRRALCKALEPACLEIIDQDGKDLALAIHGRALGYDGCRASRKLIERLPVEPIGGQERARTEGGREVANGVEERRVSICCLDSSFHFGHSIARLRFASTLAAHVTPMIAPLSSATRRDESAVALLLDHAAAVRAVTYAEPTCTTLLDAEKR
ncbi:hypothetical protein K438DRAFT_1980136 [Mycena galopus ATCC 62051]|nr:hypothetical protein K438DRAFT_1980136 [Mycena galopus ATCC 62051]